MGVALARGQLAAPLPRLACPLGARPSAVLPAVRSGVLGRKPPLPARSSASTGVGGRRCDEIDRQRCQMPRFLLPLSVLLDSAPLRDWPRMTGCMGRAVVASCVVP